MPSSNGNAEKDEATKQREKELLRSNDAVGGHNVTRTSSIVPNLASMINDDNGSNGGATAATKPTASTTTTLTKEERRKQQEEEMRRIKEKERSARNMSI